MKAMREVGATLDGKFEILRQLGSGGMGEVYLARHLHLDEERIIKVLHPAQADDPVAHKRFLRAAKTAVQIKHPNVAILYDSAKLPDGSDYLVWEYVDGVDVGVHIASDGPFPLETALDLGIQGLRGLDALHQAGVIHRDISPDNLMITRDAEGLPQLKIIDLGLAKDLSPKDSEVEVTQAGMFLGKLRYCSPEQAGMVDGQQLDRRSDLYSFAMVLYEMLCGLPPFESQTHQGFVFKRLTEDPIPLVDRNPDLQLAAEVDAVVLKGLEKDREQRYLDATSFRRALEELKSKVGQHSTREVPRYAVDSVPEIVQTNLAATRTASQLTREERDEILGQIQLASQRMEQVDRRIAAADRALAAGDLAEARRIAKNLNAKTPRARGLADLEQRISRAEDAALAEALSAPARPKPAPTQAAPLLPSPPPAPEPSPEPATEEPAVQPAAEPAAEPAAPPAASQEVDPLEAVRKAEQMLVKYIEAGQLPLARLALETLLDVAPDHPRRGNYEKDLKRLAENAEREKKGQELLEQAREELERGNEKKARRRLSQLQRLAGAEEQAALLESELDAAAQRQAFEEESEEHRQRFESLLEEGRVDAASREIERLASLGLPRLTLDLFQERLSEARLELERRSVAASYETRFEDRVQEGDWPAARQVASELAQRFPGYRRASEMLGEIAKGEEAERRRESVGQGERQVEALIAAGQADQAEMALKVLLRLDPDNAQRKSFERQIAALRA